VRRRYALARTAKSTKVRTLKRASSSIFGSKMLIRKECKME
jgi:hypothetical protein